ncbi:19637_t:CDS:2, partial [Gigaspora rosea]
MRWLWDSCELGDNVYWQDIVSGYMSGKELECIRPVNIFGVSVPVQDSVEVVPVCYNPGILEVSNQVSEVMWK